VSRPWPGAGRWVFAGAAAAYVVFAAYMATRPVIWLVGLVPDDTFYYLQTARHIAAVGRSTFDGINPTNGYHPAWMLVLSGWAAVFHGREALLRAAMATALAAHLATAGVVVALMRPLVGRWWAWVTGAGWLWNPLPLLLAMEAMEASVSLLAVAVFAVVCARRILPWLDGGRPFAPERRDVVSLGLALAAVVWARTDGLVLAFVALAFPVVLTAARGPWRDGARAALRLGPAAAVVVGALGLWWLFSYAQVGSVVQDSAVMKALWGRAQTRGAGAIVARAHHFIHGAVAGAITYMSGELSDLAATWEAAGLVLVGLGAARARGTRARRLRRLLALLALAVLALFAAYGAGSADVQSWYLGLPGFTLWLMALGSLAVLAGRGRRGRIVGTAVRVLAAGLGASFWRSPVVPYPWQRDVLASLPAFEARIPPDARVGCFNAGVPAFFGARTVINLDGLVNHAVVPYWRARRFEEYLRDARIAFIADEEGALRRARLFSSADLPLAPVGSIALTGWPTSRRYLWRVESETARGRQDPGR